MECILDKFKQSHATKYGTILEFEFPKNKFGFRRAYLFPSYPAIPAKSRYDSPVTPHNLTSYVSTELTAHAMSRETAQGLTYLIHVKELTGHWLGICPEQHRDLIRDVLATKGMLWHTEPNPMLTIFSKANIEQNYQGIPFICDLTIGPRRVVFANTYKTRPDSS